MRALAAVVASATIAMPAAQDVARRYAPAIVVVERDARKSHGFFVSSSGLLCTVLPGAQVGDVVQVDGDGEGPSERGVVRVIDEDGLALVAVDTLDVAGHERAALGVSTTGQPSRWLVGLARDDDGVVRGALGGIESRTAERWRLLLPLPRGAPILDERSAVVAVAFTPRGGGQLDALPAERVKRLAARLAPPG